jgi:hypothetical protein
MKFTLKLIFKFLFGLLCKVLFTLAVIGIIFIFIWMLARSDITPFLESIK